MDKERILKELSEIVGQRNVIHKPHELMVYESDGLTMNRYPPDFVVIVSTVEEISRVVKLARREGIPYTARGAGTGLSGGALAARGGIVITLVKMNHILEIDLENRLAVVEAGVTNLAISEAVAPQGFYFVPDPSSQVASTIGGNVGANAGGGHCLKYGVTTNHVLGLEVVLPDGEVTWLGSRTGDAPGYDLTGVMVGSEGTLGIVTKVVVRLLPKPEAAKTLLAVFETIEDACNVVSDLIGHGIIAAAMEIMDQLALQAVEADAHAGYPLDAGAVILIEVDGLKDGLEEQARRIEATCLEHGARSVHLAETSEERLKLWAGRKRAFGAIGWISPAYYIQDGVVPRTKLPEVVREVSQVGEKYAFRIANIFHAGDGNLHPLVLYDETDEGQRHRVIEAGHETLRLCVAFGGSVSGEHGIGLEKRSLMRVQYAEEDLAAMAKVKAAFDPEGLCNPGKIFPES